MKYTATVGDHEQDVSAEDLAELAVRRAGPQEYHLLEGDRGYRCEVHSLDRLRGEVVLTINGRRHTVSLAGPVQRLVRQLGFATVASAAANAVTAPMPGLILSINVSEGDTIEEGTPLLVLEAMKMENVIKATGAGTVQRIAVTKGQAVEKRQLLIELA